MMSLWMRKIRRLPDDYDDDKLFDTSLNDGMDDDSEEYTNDYWLPEEGKINMDDDDWLPDEGEIELYTDDDDTVNDYN